MAQEKEEGKESKHVVHEGYLGKLKVVCFNLYPIGRRM